MLVCAKGEITDSKVISLSSYLQEGDVLVFNDARVIKAKLSAKILRSGAEIQLNLDQGEGTIWQALCRGAKKVKAGDILQIAEEFSAEILEKNSDGFIKIKFSCSDDELAAMLEKYGETPLPPYIKRAAEKKDEENYQTIYAARGAAVAAPTAGLHFNEKVFATLDAKKIEKVFVTLNVGAGTFLPVRSDFLADHKMHREFFSISKEVAEKINSAKKSGKKIVAVGTTSLRVLESCANAEGMLEAASRHTEIFIHPPYRFKIADALLTNFHLPKSTLFMLICAFLGKEKAFEVYNHAIFKRYRFYSYGDCSLLIP